jgi:hypothetical protein
MTQETVNVEGISCMHCQLRVKKAVEAGRRSTEGGCKPSDQTGNY